MTADEVREIEDVVKLLEMRIGLETEMASLAAERRTENDLAALRANLDAMEASSDIDASVAADAAFHAAIARATGNDYYRRFTDFLGVRLVPSRKLHLQGSGEQSIQRYAQGINRDHSAIYDAIADQESARARSAARRHLQKSLERHRSLANVAVTSE